MLRDRSAGTAKISSYQSLPRPKQQQHFPHKRRSVKPKLRATKLEKDQSTLTQLDFISTPKSNEDVVLESSDEEFEDPRPAKKRRKSRFNEKEAGQSTLTQMVDFSFPRIQRVDSDSFQIWEDDLDDDYIPEEDIPEPRTRKQQRQSRLGQTRLPLTKDTENEVEIPSTSQQAESSPRIDSGIETEVIREGESPATPSNTRVKEIPSSQTPPDTNYSTRSSFLVPVDQQRSPLRERSTNVLSTHHGNQSPESQAVHKTQERVQQGTRNPILIEGTSCAVIYQKTPEVQPARSVFKSSPRRSSRKFQPTTTIQDSQPDDMDLSLSTFEAVYSSTNPMPELQRVMTVPDSQPEDSQVLVPGSRGLGATWSSEGWSRENPQSYGGYTQATFDPVMSALDRDAARFAWTQTQAGTRSVAHPLHDDSETDDEDLDRGCGSPTGATDVVHKQSPGNRPAHNVDSSVGDLKEALNGSDSSLARPHEPQKLYGDDDTGEITLVPVDIVLISSPPSATGGSGTQYIGSRQSLSSPRSVLTQTPTLDDEVEEIVPSSPRCHHAFQNSSIFPTQASLNHDLSTFSNEDEAAIANTYASEASTIPPYYPSPHRPRVAVAQPASSLALPLPPWSSPFSRPGAHTATARVADAQDWSLPPPPPMSSSRAATPASSKT